MPPAVPIFILFFSFSFRGWKKGMAPSSLKLIL